MGPLPFELNLGNAPVADRYTRTKSVLRARANEAGTPGDILERMGWRRNDPRSLVERWVSLGDGRIPSSFPSAIGFSLDELQRAVEMDLDIFQTQLVTEPFELKYFRERPSPVVSFKHPLPSDIGLDGAVAFVAAFNGRSRMRCELPVGTCRKFIFEADGRTWILTNRPAIRVEGRWIVFL